MGSADALMEGADPLLRIDVLELPNNEGVGGWVVALKSMSHRRGGLGGVVTDVTGLHVKEVVQPVQRRSKVTRVHRIHVPNVMAQRLLRQLCEYPCYLLFERPYSKTLSGLSLV